MVCNLSILDNLKARNGIKTQWTHDMNVVNI